MTQAMDHLRAEVARAQSVMAAATTLITTVAGHIRDNAEDPVALNALADSLDSSAAGLASAVTENTAAANLGGSTDVPAGGGTDTGTGGTDTTGAAGGDTTGAAAGGDATGAGTDTGGASGTDTTGSGSSDTASGGTDTTGTSGDEQPV